MTIETCKNCGEQLQGVYCHSCGEKVVESNDFLLKTLLGQVADGLFNIDSKVFRTFKYLLFKPGRLSTNYVEGIRKPFMKPIQLFLISNVLFFLLLTQADILRIPATYYFTDNRAESVRKAMNETGLSEPELRQAYDKKSTDLSKAAIFLMIPLLMLVLAALFFQSKRFFGMHLIFSIHYVSFFFLSCLLAVLVSNFGNKLPQYIIISLNLFYLILAIREFYKTKWSFTILKSTLFLIAFIGLTLGYRTFISYVSFKLL